MTVGFRLIILLVHLIMSTSASCNLRQVSDADNLTVAISHFLHNVRHTIGYLAGDSGIYFVEYNGRKLDGTGYHFYIRRDGQILTTRPVERAGAHARGYNAHSIGIAYEGGLDHYGNPKDTRTEWQRHSLRVLVRALLMDYPEAKVAGHRDLSPDLNNNGEVEPMEWTKQCPCFEVKKEKW